MPHGRRMGVRDARRLAGWLRQRERGQMLLVFALLVIPVSFVLAAVAVDASLWQSERRGAQKDADLAALAGALELVFDKTDEARAVLAAQNAADANDEAGNAPPLSVASSEEEFGVHVSWPCVAVNLRHDSRTFFASIFGVPFAPDIGAHAKACAGAAQNPQGLIPIETNTEMSPLCFDQARQPNLGQPCPMDFGSNNNPQGANPRGLIDLLRDSDYCSDRSVKEPDLLLSIELGATGNCRINEGTPCGSDPWRDCVSIRPGNPTNVGRAFERRIAREGACDTDADGIEELEEVTTILPGTNPPTYEPRDCDPNTDGLQMSPRLVTIIVLEDAPPTGPSNSGHPIYAFAGMYIMGCTGDATLESLDDLDPFCDMPGGGNGYRQPTEGERSVSFVSFPQHHRCGHQQVPTCTPVPSMTPTQTPTPGGPQPTPTPGNGGGPGGGNGGGQGHVVVWGTFLNLFFAGGEVGPPTEATTAFSISLVE